MLDFRSLCLAAFSHLGATAAEELAEGQVVSISGIETQILFNGVDDFARMYCEVGTPYPNAELQVYQQLLELQLIFIDTIDAMFVRDGLNDRLLFTVRLPLSDEVAPEAFATFVTDLVEQVVRWRAALLTGLIIEQPPEENMVSSTKQSALLA